MLRRVEPTSVTVFVALSQSRTVTVGVYKEGATSAYASAFRLTQSIGTNLHVVAVTVPIPANDPLQADVVYRYDVSFGNNQSLATLGLLGGDFPLGYVADQLPTFVLPPTTVDGLYLVHGSCRKAWGVGPDALSTLDAVIAEARSDAVKRLLRPHLLLLSGDQIYADEVAPTHLALASEIGQMALGWAEEQLPGATGTITRSSPSLAPSNRTGELLEARFTSEIMDSHLVTLGEFYAMYLLAWAPDLWFDAAKNLALPDRNALISMLGAAPSADQVSLAEKRFGETQEHVKAFVTTLPQVRRALANVPTLMIFDDHEVSDDWNLDNIWRTTVEGTQLGLRVLTNALAAYAVFQAWGNDPAQFEASSTVGNPNPPGWELLWHLSFEKGNENSTTRELLGLDRTSATPSIVWDYVLDWPTEYRVIVLDTRTHRGTDLSLDAAETINATGITNQLVNRIAKSVKPLTIVVSAGPILGNASAEAIQLTYTRKGRTGALEKDAEPWSFNEIAYQRVLSELAKATTVVVLSGDVHYGFAATLDYWDERAQPVTAPTARIVQLNSSPFKNEADALKSFLLVAADKVDSAGVHVGPLKREDRSYLGWPTGGAHLANHLLGAIEPVTVGSGRPGIPVVEEVPTTRAEGWVTRPQWRYRMNFNEDLRDNPDRRPPDAVQIAYALSDNPVEIAAVHAFYYVNGQRRRFVGTNHIGLVRFTWTGAQKSLVQALGFTWPGTSAAWEGAVFEVSLAPTTLAKPELTHA